MATAKEIRRENLKVLVERFGSMKSLNERLGRKDNTLTQILNASIHSETGKKKQMGDRLARSIEQTLSLGDGWMDADHSEDPDAKSNLIALNKLSIEAGCNPAGGSGGEACAIVERIEVTPEWYKQNISRYRLHGHDLITARGDSMEPTINSGDIVVVDTHDHDLTQEGIFCVNYGAGVMLKRIQVLPFGVEFISDNKLYNPFVLKGQEVNSVNIIGRVVTALCVRKFPRGI